MKRVGFFASISWDLFWHHVFRPNMHWSASTTNTPISRIIFLMHGDAQGFAWAGFSWRNIRHPSTCFLYNLAMNSMCLAPSANCLAFL